MKHFTANLTLLLALLFTFTTTTLSADDLCYTGIDQSGFVLLTQTTIPIKNISDQTLEDVKFYVDETGMSFEFGSNCGTDAVDGSCDAKSNIEMGPFGFLGDTTEYLLNDISSNQIVDTWTRAFFDMSFFTSLSLYATYEKDGILRKAKISKCSDAEIIDPISYPDPEYEQCGVFPSALNTWDVIYPANGDVVISADTIYADDIDGAVKCSSTDEYQNAVQLDNCAVDELTIDEPVLPDNIPSTLDTTIDISGDLYESNYPNIALVGNTRFQATQHYDNDPNKKAFMAINSLVSTDSDITITLTEGDYYFGSWESNAKLTVRMEGKVTIYIDGDMNLYNNDLDFNYDGGNGVPADAYIFIGGNFNMDSQGGGPDYNIIAYVFAQGTFAANINTTNSSFQGSVSSVGSMTLNNNQTYIYDPSGLTEDGFGECPPLATPYTTGPFDAWDIFRDNISTPPSDRNISTKIVNAPFTISLASLNKDSDAYELKEGLGDMDIAIYPKNSNTAISNSIIYNPGISSHIAATSNFTVTKAEDDAVVGFKLCATYEHNETLNENIYYLYPTASCSFQSTLNDCDAVTNGTPTWHVCHSTDNFAIRPKNFNITPVSAKIISAKQQAYVIQANDDLDLPTIGYTLSQADYAMTTIDTKYMPDDTVNNALIGISTVNSFSFSDGLSTDTNLSYSDIGKVGISMQDRTWALVDIDDTPQTCNADGAYVCGETNATFIPKQFTFGVTRLNDKAATYTYISNDLNMSAQVSLVVNAVNENDVITQNFTASSWEEPTSLDIAITSTASTPTLLKSVIAANKLGFNAGTLTLSTAETNSSKKLLFNFTRTNNTALNPFRIDGSEVTASALSTYASGEIVAGSSLADQNATFIYGRTHATRHRFTGPTGTALIYYEAYCSGTTTCDKTLLPNTINSKTTDDPRWFINPLHAVMAGEVGTVTQKGTSSPVTTTAATGTNIANVALTYDESKGYPYKATMENNASSWLVYNPNNIADTNNDFDVEFVSGTSSWAGQKETDTVTNRNASDKTNRRSMW